MHGATQLEDADDVLEELEEALIVSGALRALARRPLQEC
jgi:hypothetical protein